MDDDTRIKIQTPAKTQKIFVVNHLSRYSVRVKKIQHLTSALINALGVSQYEVAIEFVGPGRMRTINRKYRGADKSTDVLSFPQQVWKKSLAAKLAPSAAKIHRQKSTKAPTPVPALGDVIISLPDAERNARSIGQSLDREVGFLIVHGILHLCGHDHMRPSEERAMRREQRKLMQVLSRNTDAPLWKSCVSERRRQS